MSTQNDETNVEATQQGPGERLTQARDALNLSIEDVATKLHLTKRCIIDLEENNYHTSIPLTFMRGYLRAYARMLELPENEIMNAFKALDIPDEAEQTYSGKSYNNALISLKSSHHWKIKSYQVLVILLGIAIILGLFTWWRVNLPIERMGINDYPAVQLESLTDENDIEISFGADES